MNNWSSEAIASFSGGIAAVITAFATWMAARRNAGETARRALDDAQEKFRNALHEEIDRLRSRIEHLEAHSDAMAEAARECERRYANLAEQFRKFRDGMIAE